MTVASWEAITNVAVPLTWSYFHIARETYLVSIPQKGITTSIDKVDILLSLVQIYQALGFLLPCDRLGTLQYENTLFGFLFHLEGKLPMKTELKL